MMRASAFTIAETLITLGIIGIIAALTLPSLVTKYQKKETITKIKRFYSVINEAVRLSETANGPVSEWDNTLEAWDAEQTLAWYNKYLNKYIKTTKVEKKPPRGINIYFADGTAANINNYGGLDIHYITNIKNENHARTYFYFKFRPAEHTRNLVIPYGFGSAREILINDSTHGCNNINGSSTQVYCSALIMNDGWEIKDDYPW